MLGGVADGAEVLSLLQDSRVRVAKVRSNTCRLDGWFIFEHVLK